MINGWASEQWLGQQKKRAICEGGMEQEHRKYESWVSRLKYILKMKRCCTYNPAAPGSNPEHNIFAFFKIEIELWRVTDENKQKEAGIGTYFKQVDYFWLKSTSKEASQSLLIVILPTPMTSYFSGQVPSAAQLFTLTSFYIFKVALFMVTLAANALDARDWNKMKSLDVFSLSIFLSLHLAHTFLLIQNEYSSQKYKRKSDVGLPLSILPSISQLSRLQGRQERRKSHVPLSLSLLLPHNWIVQKGERERAWTLTHFSVIELERKVSFSWGMQQSQ